MINPLHIIDIENYEIIKQLGEGFFGEVFLVKKKGKEELYVAKQSKKKYQIDLEKKHDIEPELFSFCNLKNPAIVEVIGYSLTGFNGENNPVIIMKYMPNLSLLDVFHNNREKLTPKIKYILILGISLALEHIHSKKIIHRDLKPGNILIDEKFYPYISDFGISYISDIELTKKIMESGVGTTMYFAPEMINDDGYTYKVDIYAAALIFYEIITGKELFNGLKNEYKIIKLISERYCQDTSMINNKFIVSFLKSCWKKNPKKRPRSKKIVKIVKGKKFRNFFNVTEDEVNEYLSIFGQKLENNKSKKEILDSELQRLYEKKDINEMMKIAKRLRKGNDEEKRKAANLYKKLADGGYHMAMNDYALMLYYGEGIKEDKKLAVSYFKKAKNKGNLNSMKKYADMLYFGDTITKNKTKAAKLYYKLAKNGNIYAAYNYAIIILKKEINTGLLSKKKRKEKIKKAVEFMKMSADGGNDVAIFEYADMLLNGREVAKNKEEAARYYKILGDKNNSTAAHDYAVLLLKGKKSYNKKKEAAKYMKKAADLGDVDAKYNFGIMLFNGDGVIKNLSKSKKYIKEAAEKGFQKAIDFLDNNFKEDDLNEEDKNNDNDLKEEDENDDDLKEEEENDDDLKEEDENDDDIKEDDENDDDLKEEDENNDNDLKEEDENDDDIKEDDENDDDENDDDDLKEEDENDDNLNEEDENDDNLNEEDENDDDDLNIILLSKSTNIETSEEDSELTSSYNSESYSYYYISSSDDSDSDNLNQKKSKNSISIKSSDIDFNSIPDDLHNKESHKLIKPALSDSRHKQSNESKKSSKFLDFLSNSSSKKSSDSISISSFDLDFLSNSSSKKSSDSISISSFDLDFLSNSNDLGKKKSSDSISTKFADIDFDSNSDDLCNKESHKFSRPVKSVNSNSDSKNKIIASSNSIDLSPLTFYKKRIICFIFVEIANSCKIKFENVFNSDLIFFDGVFKKEKFRNCHPSKHVNKIPGLWNIMEKRNFFSSLIKMQSKHTKIYKDFIPITYFLPEDVDKYYQQIKTTKYLLRYDDKYEKIEILCSENENLRENKFNSIIQPFIQPFLINDRKFHIRIYLMIACIDPLTLYIYDDGEAFFCIEPYNTPTQENINAYLFQKNFPPNLDFEPIVPLSSIIKYISKNEDELWSKFRQIAQLSIISIHEEIIKTVKKACEINDNDFNLNDIDVIPPAKRFFNLIAIDILIDENRNLFINEIYDNPGMKPLNDFDHKFKSRLIESSFQLYAKLLKKTDNELKNWTQILPSDDKAINSLLTKTRSSSLCNKNRNYYKPTVVPFKLV